MSDDLVSRLQSDARLESSGRFSWDFARLGRVLEQYHLADPEHYLLRALACAVAGGATYFHLEQGALTTRLRWDGADVTPEQLAELSPLSGPEHLRELALALMAAERLGKVQLQAGFREVCLVLRRSGWRHLFGRSRSLILLAERCRHARLLLPVGAPRLADPLVAFECEWGDGRIGFGAGKTLIIRDGVSFPGPLIPGLEVTWWSSNLPLDLSRSGIVHGPELADWMSQLTARVMALLTNPNCPPNFRAWALEHGLGYPSFETAPIFGLGNGRWATYEELHREYAEAGYLRVLSGPQPLAAVVIDSGCEAFLKHHFPLQLPIEEVKPGYARLPEGEEYLLKWPLGKAELGLRSAVVMEFRQWTEFGWEVRRAHPFGVDIAGEPGTWRWWPEALRLLARMRGAHGTLVQFHFLSYFLAWSQVAPERIDGEGRLEVWRQLHPASDLLDWVEFRRRRGGAISLSRLLAEKGNWPLNDPSGHQGLLVEPFVAGILRQLLVPGTTLGSELTSLSRRASAVLEGGVWRNLLRDQDCASSQALREAGLTLENFEPLGDWRQRLPGVLRSTSRVATTVHVLLAMGVTGLEPLVETWGERENIDDLLEDEVHFVGDLRVAWLVKLAWCRARSGQLERALARAEQAVLEFPRSWIGWDTLGQIQACTGELEVALVSHRECLRLQGHHPVFKANYAEALWACGDKEAARALLDEPEDLMQARLEEDPEVALKLCQELVTRPDCSPSVHERMAEVLDALGRTGEAREHYRLFVTARPDQLLEANIGARLEAAVCWLRLCEEGEADLR